MSLVEKREIEKKKYVALYKERPSYGDFDHSRVIRGEIVDLSPESIIDVGCGGGQFVLWCKSRGIFARGVDIASPFDCVAPAHDLPFEDDSFDYLTAFDMLEHLVEEDVENVLEEFNRVATKGFVFKIAYVQSVGKGINGELLHPTVKPESWWIDKIKKYGNVRKSLGYIICEFDVC